MTGRPSQAAARDAVLDALRRGHKSVLAIARHLGVTDNAVRVHLVTLERDGLVARAAAVRSGRPGQPAVTYALTPAGEAALSRAYPAALAALVAALGDRLDRAALRRLFADAGTRIVSSDGAAPQGTLEQRAQAGADLLRSLGGAAEVVRTRGEVTVVGQGCPLSVAVRECAATCTIVESLLAARTGAQVAQACTHGDQPACRFRLTQRA